VGPASGVGSLRLKTGRRKEMEMRAARASVSARVQTRFNSIAAVVAGHQVV
jgi:hypothetical protein